MKTRFFALIFSLGLMGAAFAQEAAVTESPAAPAPAPDRTVYAPRLPKPTELTKIAAAQGLVIDRIEETPAQMIVTTRNAEGRTTTVAYRLLATAGNWPATSSNSTTVTESAPQTTVVTVKPRPANVVYVSGYSYPYYGYGPYYGPYWGAGYYAPVAVSVGFGWGWGYGGYYGGYRGGYCAPYYGGRGYHGGHRH